jgi:GT2 family glycosyltransferase
MQLTIIVITRNRPQMVEKCLEHIHAQSCSASEIIVVDSSNDTKTKELIEQRFPAVCYLYLTNGKNKMQVSRNLGIKHSHSDIIAFLDDDSMPDPDWAGEIVRAYVDDSIGGVGGLVLEPHGPLEEPQNGRHIGAVLPNGERVTNYHLNPGRVIEVDLVRGCNMSFRRSLFSHLGEFDPAYTGSNAFEAGDYCLRVRNAGYKILFNPGAKVLHLSAKREDVPRELTDPRSQFFQARNWTLWVGKNLTFRPEHLSHLWIKETYRVFQKHQGTLPKKILITGSNIIGKIVGTWAWGKWRLFH